MRLLQVIAVCGLLITQALAFLHHVGRIHSIDRTRHGGDFNQLQLQYKIRCSRPQLGMPFALRSSVLHSSSSNSSSNKDAQKLKKKRVVNNNGTKVAAVVREKKMTRPFVERVHSDESRLSPKNFKIGQQLRGKIISIVDFGLFVDVGSLKDALVHIKDVSKDYFVQNLQTKFIPGQDIDCWVKFVNEKENKIGLQMFSPQLTTTAAATDAATTAVGGDDTTTLEVAALDSYQVEQAVTGTVVKFSDFGAFVDIGAEVLAFMHRRKMKSNRRQRNYKPWELIALGTQLPCFIHEVDLQRRRISLTSYDPQLWDTRLNSVDDRGKRAEAGYEGLGSALASATAAGDDDLGPRDPMVEDDEELGGSTRAANLLALKRTLELSLDDDDDDDDDDYEEDEEEDDDDAGLEYIDDDDVAEQQQSKLLLDDLEDRSNSKGRGNVPTARKTGATKFELLKKQMMQEEDNSDDLDEEFNLIASGRSHIYLKDVKTWAFVRLPLEAGVVTLESVRKIFQSVRPDQGKIDADQFAAFVESFEELLQLGDGSSDSADQQLLADLEKIDQGASAADFDNDIDDDDNVGITGVDSDDGDVEQAYKYSEKADPCLQEHSRSSSKEVKRSSGGYKSFLDFDLKDDDSNDEDDLDFDDEDDDEEDDDDFLFDDDDDDDDDFLFDDDDDDHQDRLRNDIIEDSDREVSSKSAGSSSNKATTPATTVAASTATRSVKQNKAEDEEKLEERILEEELQELTAEAGFGAAPNQSGEPVASDSEQLLIRNLFSELAGDATNQKTSRVPVEDLFLTSQQLQSWDFVQTLSSRHATAAALIESAFRDCIAADPRSIVQSDFSEGLMGINAFQRFMQRLGQLDQDITDFGDDRIYEMDELTGGEEELVGGEEEISMEEAFAEVLSLNSNPKEKGATLQALQQWSMVAGLLDGGDLTQAQLVELFERAIETTTAAATGSGKKSQKGGQQKEKTTAKKQATTLSLEAFDAFLDLIEPFFTADEEFSESQSSFPEGEIAAAINSNFLEEYKSIATAVAAADVAATTTTEDEPSIPKLNNKNEKEHSNEDEEEDRELLQNVFSDISNGKSYVTMKDLLKWDFVYSLVAEGVLSEASLAARIAALNPSQPKRLTLQGLDTFVDEIVLLYAESGSQDEYDDDESEDAAAAADEFSDDDGVAVDEVRVSAAAVPAIIISGSISDEDGDDSDVTDFGNNNKNNNSNNSNESDGYNGEDGDEEDFMEIDADDAFTRLAQGRDHITIQDLKGWDVIAEAFAFSSLESLTAEDWEEVMELADVSDATRVSLAEFEDILDVLFDRIDDDDDDTDDDDAIDSEMES